MPVNKIKRDLTNVITNLYVKTQISEINNIESTLLEFFIDDLCKSFSGDHVDYILNEKIYRKNNHVKITESDFTKVEQIRKETSKINLPKIIIHNDIDSPPNKLLILTHKSDQDKIHEELEKMNRIIQTVINNPKQPFLVGASILFYQEAESKGSLLIKYNFGTNRQQQ